MVLALALPLFSFFSSNALLSLTLLFTTALIVHLTLPLIELRVLKNKHGHRKYQLAALLQGCSWPLPNHQLTGLPDRIRLCKPVFLQNKLLPSIICFNCLCTQTSSQSLQAQFTVKYNSDVSNQKITTQQLTLNNRMKYAAPRVTAASGCNTALSFFIYNNAPNTGAIYRNMDSCFVLRHFYNSPILP